MEDEKNLMKNSGSYPCAKKVWDDRKQKYVWHPPHVICDYRGCDNCAWNPEEADRRSKIPLTLCKDGLRRKIISHRPTDLEETETEEKTDG